MALHLGVRAAILDAHLTGAEAMSLLRFYFVGRGPSLWRAHLLASVRPSFSSTHSG